MTDAAGFELSYHLDADAAHGLRQILIERLSAHEATTLDANGVNRVGTHALQVLVAAARDFAAAGLDLKVNNPSPALIEAWRVAGLAKTLPLAARAGVE